MRTVSVSSLLIALALTPASTNLRAQQNVLNMRSGNQDCPVDFQLQRNNRGALAPALVTSTSQDVPAKRSVQVSLSSQDGKTITAADITLYAPHIGNRATPARVIYGQDGAQPDSVTKTYHLAQSRDAKGETAKGPLTGDLELLDTMAGVASASIRSVIYADGSKWLPGNGAACVAAPRMYMEVGRR